MVLALEAQVLVEGRPARRLGVQAVGGRRGEVVEGRGGAAARRE
jgi:hypothetical protein